MSKNFFIIVQLLAAFFLFAAYSVLYAKVSGACSSCHTMHNSQDGATEEADGPQEKLMISTCVGCHSLASSRTVTTIASSDLPVVYNSSQPNHPLAGGNFYWMVNQADDSLGHNVRGIAGPDSNLNHVVGRTIGGNSNMAITDCYNCHKYGFEPGYPGIPFTIQRSGDVLICRDCHTAPAHHADDSDTVVDGDGGWYRFLYGVKGIEDPDWQRSVSASDHNEYQGETAAHGGSISDKGCACHGDLHALKTPLQVGDGSPWFKHPADVAIPEEGEYSAYTAYNPEAPVARPDLAGYSGPSSIVTPGTDQVMCISCHRAHGSDRPDMLRWNYDDMLIGSENGSGCFICHTSKDE